jgi:hypothetical protein
VRGIVAASVIAFVVSLAAPANASVVPPAGSESASRHADVLMSWDGTTETLDIALSMAAAGERVGIIVPTPRKPEVSLSDADLFDRLEAATAARTVTEDDWWGRPTPAPTAAAPADASLGDLEQTTIRASESRALTRWLRDNELSISKETRTLLADYAESGWSLTLATFTAPQGSAVLQPMRFAFRAKEPVFPLRLWSTAGTALSMRFYAIGEGRTELREDSRAARPIDAAQSVAFAGPTEGTEFASLGTYLTVTDVRIDKPAEQIGDDIAFQPAVANDEIVPTSTVYRPVELLGFPLGWLLVVWGGLGLAVGIGFLVPRLRAR